MALSHLDPAAHLYYLGLWSLRLSLPVCQRDSGLKRLRRTAPLSRAQVVRSDLGYREDSCEVCIRKLVAQHIGITAEDGKG